MFKTQNFEIAVALFLSTTMISCFGTDNSTSDVGTIGLSENEVTVLPHDNHEYRIEQDTDIKQEYKFTN